MNTHRVAANVNKPERPNSMARAARFLFSAALLGLLASANAALTCNDLVVPSLGNDATVSIDRDAYRRGKKTGS